MVIKYYIVQDGLTRLEVSEQVAEQRMNNVRLKPRMTKVSEEIIPKADYFGMVNEEVIVEYEISYDFYLKRD